MKYSLRKESEGNYIDQDNCSWESPEQWLFGDIIGGCMCGSSDKLTKDTWEVLDYFSKPFEKRGVENPIQESLTKELIAHILDDKELLEHGGSIFGSWLTEEGKNVYNIILKFFKE